MVNVLWWSHVVFPLKVGTSCGSSLRYAHKLINCLSILWKGRNRSMGAVFFFSHVNPLCWNRKYNIYHWAKRASEWKLQCRLPDPTADSFQSWPAPLLWSKRGRASQRERPFKFEMEYPRLLCLKLGSLIPNYQNKGPVFDFQVMILANQGCRYSMTYVVTSAHIGVLKPA